MNNLFKLFADLLWIPLENGVIISFTSFLLSCAQFNSVTFFPFILRSLRHGYRCMERHKYIPGSNVFDK